MRKLVVKFENDEEMARVKEMGNAWAKKVAAQKAAPDLGKSETLELNELALKAKPLSLLIGW